MKREKDIQGPENTNPSIDSRELAANVTELKPSVLPSLLTMVLLLENCGGGGGPVVIPDLQTKIPNTFVPTETPRPTEKPAAEYKALILDITSLVEANPETIAQEYKDLQTYSFNLAKEMTEFVRFTPRIWSLSVADDGPKIDENLILAQNQTTNEFYLLAAVTGSGVEAKTTLLKEKVYAEVVMGENGNFKSLSYYYLELDGTRKEFIGSNPETNGGYTYTMTDGNKVILDEVPIAIGGSEGPIGSKALFSIVPQQENFYDTLPKDAIINTQTGKIELNSEILYYSEDNQWLKQPEFENTEDLEFSPLLPKPEWINRFIGHVELNGKTLDIPISIGASNDVANDVTPPINRIKGVWMTQEGVDFVADAYLNAFYYRWSVIDGNVGTKEEWFEKVLNNSDEAAVRLLVQDNEKKDDNGNPLRRVAMIRFNEGFSLLYVDKFETNIGVQVDRINRGFFGVTGHGQLILASDFYSFNDFSINSSVNGVSTSDYAFVFSSFAPISEFGVLKNECIISGSVLAKCGEPKITQEILDFWKKLRTKENTMLDSGNIKLDFGLVK